mgnify:FL=1
MVEEHEHVIHAEVVKYAHGRRRRRADLRQAALIGLWLEWPMWRNSDDKSKACQAIVGAALRNSAARKQSPPMESRARRRAVAESLWLDPGSASAAQRERYEHYTSALTLLDTTRPALTRKQRLTFYMRHVLRLTEAEIGGIQGVSQQMVSKRLAACTRRLHQQAARIAPGQLLELRLHDVEGLSGLFQKGCEDVYSDTVYEQGVGRETTSKTALRHHI